MDIEKKMAKKSFAILAIALIAYELMFQFIVFGVDMVEMSLLLFLFDSMQWEQVTDIIYHSGVALSIASIMAMLVMGLILRKMPSFSKKQKITIKTLVMFYILMQGLQLLGNYILIPMDMIAEYMGYNFDEAMSVANDFSVLFSAFFYSVVVAPVAEEILCRGILMGYLEKYGKAFAVLITAMLFGLLHQNIVQFPITMLIGILFGYLAQRYSLMVAIVLHVLNNLSVEITSYLGQKYEIIYLIDVAFLLFCGVASIIILLIKRKSIVTFFKEDSNEMSVVKWFFTTPLMLIVIGYFLFFTIRSVTPY